MLLCYSVTTHSRLSNRCSVISTKAASSTNSFWLLQQDWERWMEHRYYMQLAERHVRDGEARVARQREIIEELRQGGHPTLDAENLLTTFEESLREHQRRLTQLRQAEDFTKFSTTA